MSELNRELAYRVQMLPNALRENVTLATDALLKVGWPRDVLVRDIHQALAWANSHRVVVAQEMTRKRRAAKKAHVSGDADLQAMFSAAGVDPSDIPSRTYILPACASKRRA